MCGWMVSFGLNNWTSFATAHQVCSYCLVLILFHLSFNQGMCVCCFDFIDGLEVHLRYGVTVCL